MNGTVKWYDAYKGYGFLLGEDGQDYFIHRSSIPLDTTLDEGDSLEFESKENDKGLEAIDVKKLS